MQMEGSHGGAVSGQPFLQLPLHFCPWISIRQGQFWVKIFQMSEQPHSSTRGHTYVLEVVSSGSISLLLDILANVFLTGSWEPLISLASRTFQWFPKFPNPPLLLIFIHSPGPLDFSGWNLKNIKAKEFDIQHFSNGSFNPKMPVRLMRRKQSNTLRNMVKQL